MCMKEIYCMWLQSIILAEFLAVEWVMVHVKYMLMENLLADAKLNQCICDTRS